MPELPEVEVIRRSLRVVEGKKIGGVSFSSLVPVETTTPAQIRKAIVHKQVVALNRRGKYLLVLVEGGVALIIHLGMSGRVRYLERRTRREKHAHMEIHFTNGSLLRLVDARRFGTISLSFRPDGHDNVFLRKLGPEYNDPALSVGDYIARFRKHPKLTLKTALLHQGIIAGLGNIYACEALYRARLDPRRQVKQTSDKKLAQLLKAIRETLELGIRWQGTTLRDYQDGLGTRGSMQNFLQVYGRAGQRPLRGQGKIIRILQNNRTTWFCPAVQK